MGDKALTGTIHDLIVVGGGLAGLTGALRATELGMRPLVLEQGEEERYPCNSRFSGGIFHIAYNEVKKPPDVLLAAIRTATAGQAHEGVARVLAENAGRLLDWLREHGARFISVGAVEWEKWLLAPPRPLRPGLDWQGRGPDVLLRTLTDRLLKAGGMLERGVRATALEPAADVIAVSGERSGAPSRWEGRTVLIADGGFQADADMFRAYLGSRPESVKQRGAATGRGDGARMAVAAGAALTQMNHFYGHLLAQECMTNEKLWPYPQLDQLAVAGIIVDRNGSRMFDEGVGGVALSNLLARVDDPLCATIIFDATIWDGPGRSARIPPNPNLEIGGGTIHRAATLDSLATQLGIDSARLAETVAAYNTALRDQRLHELCPPRRVAQHPAFPIVDGPFMGIRLCAGITYTMGGIAIDEHARVLRPDGSVIDRLYAAGATTGGVEGGGDTGGYVGGLSKAGILGLCAAEHAARRIAQ